MFTTVNESEFDIVLGKSLKNEKFIQMTQNPNAEVDIRFDKQFLFEKERDIFRNDLSKLEKYLKHDDSEVKPLYERFLAKQLSVNCEVHKLYKEIFITLALLYNQNCDENYVISDQELKVLCEMVKNEIEPHYLVGFAPHIVEKYVTYFVRGDDY